MSSPQNVWPRAAVDYADEQTIPIRAIITFWLQYYTLPLLGYVHNAIQ